MTTQTGKQLGVLGENLAQEYLRSSGYIILGQNSHSRYGEIDIIALKDEKYIFVEVKTRTSFAYGRPEDSLTYSKKQKILKTIYSFLEEQAQKKHWRFDLITIKLSQNFHLEQIDHYENI